MSEHRDPLPNQIEDAFLNHLPSSEHPPLTDDFWPFRSEAEEHRHFDNLERLRDFQEASR